MPASASAILYLRRSLEPVVLDFWFDFISPYAYFASRSLPALCAERSIAIRYRPVLLAGLLQRWGQLGHAEIAPKRSWGFRDAIRHAALHQIPFEGPATHPFNPLTALRLSLPEVAGARQAEVIAALYDAGWGRGADLGDPVALTAALDAAGLDGAAMVARTREPEIKDALRREVDAAIDAGVFGVPTFVVDGELFWGNDRLHHLTLHLDGRDPLDKSLLERMLARPMGSARRPGLAPTPLVDREERRD